MDPARVGPETRPRRFDELHADAKAAIGFSANSLRGLRERYREAYLEELGRWHAVRDELDRLGAADLAGPLETGGVDGTPAAMSRATHPAAPEPNAPAGRSPAGRSPARAARTAATDTAAEATAEAEAAPAARAADVAAEVAAEAGAEDARIRELRREADQLTADLGLHRQELAKLELAEQTLENVWLFLERGDTSLLDAFATGGDGAEGQDVPEPPSDLRLRIVEAQEAERARLAQEVHDGPAQALTNAIFQVEYIERVVGQDLRLARTELRYLRESLRRELGDVRSFISQLRPPVLDELGLEEAIGEAASNFTALTGISAEIEAAAPGDRLDSAGQTVVLRVVQESLQNVRKHAAAQHVRIGTRMEDDAWVLEVRDDGRGFDIGAVAARGRRNFGLQFMRERAELIGARLEVRSRPDGGTVVVLAIPIGGKES